MATYGGRATLQAVTRVKSEQASKVKSWTPTRLRNGAASSPPPRLSSTLPTFGRSYWAAGMAAPPSVGPVPHAVPRLRDCAGHGTQE